MSSLKLDVESKKEVISTLTAEKETLSVELEQVKASVSDKDAEIQSLQDKIAELQGKAEEVKTASREDQIKALVSEDEVEGIMSIASLLDDEKFGLYVKTLETKQAKTREEMKEIGGEGAEASTELTLAEKIAAKAKRKA